MQWWEKTRGGHHFARRCGSQKQAQQFSSRTNGRAEDEQHKISLRFPDTRESYEPSWSAEKTSRLMEQDVM